jgi:hypothetical protein
MNIKLFKVLPEEEKDMFFKELEKAVKELKLTNDIPVFCDFLEEWIETAYLYAHPESLE